MNSKLSPFVITSADIDEVVRVIARPLPEPGWEFQSPLFEATLTGTYAVAVGEARGNFDDPGHQYRTSLAVFDEDLDLIDVLDIPVETDRIHTLRMLADPAGHPVIFALTIDRDRGAVLHRLDWDGTG